MPLIQFSDSFSFGISIIDIQHRIIIDMINSLYDQINSKKITVYSVKKSIDEIFNYAATHFATEEKYFKEFGYVETLEHIEEHKKFLKSAEDLKSQYKPGKSDIAVNILNFVVDWYLEHINKTDRRYIQLFKDNGLT